MFLGVLGVPAPGGLFRNSSGSPAAGGQCLRNPAVCLSLSPALCNLGSQVDPVDLVAQEVPPNISERFHPAARLRDPWTRSETLVVLEVPEVLEVLGVLIRPTNFC